mmetsp:Transcript_16406/g.13451  ORF Transcript_16406/g.13451 Transcript_16406/m.13451 type:complete len:505 (-) Transcript_16406:439-1953(-)
MDLTLNIFKPNTLKLCVDHKVACIFNKDVTHTLREEFQKLPSVSYDQIMVLLKNRKFTDEDSKLYLDDLEPKQETYTPQEVMGLSAVMYRTLRNMRFKRDPLVIRMHNVFFTVENNDIHGNEPVKAAVKRRQMKDFQFQAFCNKTLQDLRNHWIFRENGIVFADNFNIIDIHRSLNAEVELGNRTLVSTHDQDGFYDRNYNNVYKNVSSKIYHLQKNTLERWIIVYENAPGLKEKIQAMCDKMQNQLGRLYGIRINNPNLVEVRDIQGFNWNVKEAEFVVIVLNSRANKNLLTRKYEVVKYQCYKAGEIPNQIILSKTFEQGDFIKMVSLNIMYDVIMKLPNNIGHKLVFDERLGRWIGNSTMIFSLDYEARKGYKTVAALLSYLSPDFTAFRTDYIVKDDEQELRFSEENKISFKEAIKKALLDFEFHNQCTVNKVIVLRDGVTEMQKRNVMNTEVAFFNEVFAELSREGIQLLFLTADKRISTKIFEFNAMENKLNHLEAGI